MCIRDRFLPALRLPNEIDPKWICRDKEVVRAYKADPLISPKITLRLACEILRNHETIMEKASLIKMPGLMMHAGDDHICAVGGTKDFFGFLASKDKTIRVFNDCYHEIFNETCKEEVFEVMESWFEERL